MKKKSKILLLVLLSLFVLSGIGGGGFLLLRNQNVDNPDDEVHAKAGSVSYDLDGGTWSSSYNSSDHAWKGVTFQYYIILPDKVDVIAPTGYYLSGWYCVSTENGFVFDSGITYNPSYKFDYYTGNSPTFTFKAVYTPISYKVAFDSNGGSGSMSNQSFVYDTGQKLKSNTFTKIGYHFIGWATSQLNADSNLVAYSNSDYVNNMTTVKYEIITLYAVWEANTYIVSYNSSGALGVMIDQTFVYDKTQNLTPNNFISFDRYFIGWAISQEDAYNGIARYENGEIVLNLTSVNGGVVQLYAVWRTIIYYIEFNANGGIGIMSNQEFESGVFQNLSQNTFTKTGYQFLGWALNLGFADCGVINYADQQSVKNLTEIDSEVVTLYAVWKGVNYYLEYDGNGGSGFVPTQKLVYGESEPVSKNGFIREKYIFKGWATSKDYADAGIVQYTEKEFVTNLSTIQNSFVTLYAVWEKQYTAQYDNANGYWYVEVGRTPQKRVGGLLNAKLNAATLTLSGNSYKVSKTITLNGYLYQGEEYCVYNNQWYHVDPIRWRIEGSHAAGEYVDVAQRAILSSIVYFSEYSTSGSIYDVSVADAFYGSISNSDESVNNLSTFIVSDLSGQNSKMYIASESEIGEIAGTYAVEFSDLVFDILHERFYYTRTPANDGNIRVYHGIADELASASAPNYPHGIQFIVNVSNFVCVR